MHVKKLEYLGGKIRELRLGCPGQWVHTLRPEMGLLSLRLGSEVQRVYEAEGKNTFKVSVRFVTQIGFVFFSELSFPSLLLPHSTPNSKS